MLVLGKESNLDSPLSAAMHSNIMHWPAQGLLMHSHPSAAWGSQLQALACCVLV